MSIKVTSHHRNISQMGHKMYNFGIGFYAHNNLWQHLEMCQCSSLPYIQFACLMPRSWEESKKKKITTNQSVFTVSLKWPHPNIKTYVPRLYTNYDFGRVFNASHYYIFCLLLQHSLLIVIVNKQKKWNESS